MKTSHLSCLAAFASLAALSHAQTNKFVWSTDRAGYTGTVSRFNSLADAQSNSNATGVYNLQQRDLGTGFVNGRPDFDVNSAFFLTAWYYTTSDNTNGKPKGDPSGDRYYSGWGNDNNSDNSFFQIGDTGHVSVDNMNGHWTSGAFDTFALHVDGHNATYANAFARLWNAGNPDVGGEGTSGTFISYVIDATATGLVGVNTAGVVTATNHPTSVSGTATAVFQNLSTSSPASNGFYRASLTLNTTSWAFDHQADLNGPFGASTFSAAAPEPGTIAAMGLGLAAILRRRAKKA